MLLGLAEHGCRTPNAMSPRSLIPAFSLSASLHLCRKKRSHAEAQREEEESGLVDRVRRRRYDAANPSAVSAGYPDGNLQMRSLLNVLPLLLVLAAGCGREKPFPIPAADPAEFTFFVAADTHYGLEQWNSNEQANKATIDAMKTLPGTAYPKAAGGGTVGIPVGVLVAGDLTDTAQYLNWYGYRLLKRHDGFKDDYGFRGEGRLPYPVFEAFGNHDLAKGRTYVLDAIRARNKRRTGLQVSESGLQSSWDWGGIHFVNLGLYPGETKQAAGSLAFLQKDKERLTPPEQPVILFHHYGFDDFSTQERWWTQPERDAYFAEIKDLNVLAIFHGHLHAQRHYQWNGIDVFLVGKAPEGKWLAVRVTPEQLTVACRKAQGWGPCWKKSWKTSTARLNE